MYTTKSTKKSRFTTNRKLYNNLTSPQQIHNKSTVYHKPATARHVEVSVVAPMPMGAQLLLTNHC